MHTNNLRKLASETNDGVLRGPVFDAADEIYRLRAEVERLNNALTEAANQIGDLATRLGQAEGRLDASELVGVVEGWKARAETAEAERDEARAQAAEARMDVVAMSEMAAALIEDMSKSTGTTWGQLKAAVRALGDLGDRHALQAYGREKVREGMRMAADIALCHSDDRPRRYSMDWNDGYIDGCKGASDAILAEIGNLS